MVKQMYGTVISTKMNKTIVILVNLKYSHPIYSKIITKTKKYLVHDEFEQCNIGDFIQVQPCRPLSRKKRWFLTDILSKISS